MDVHKMRLPTEAKKEIQRVLKDGWSLEMGGKHYKLRRPQLLGGGMVIVSTSSSDSDYAHILRREIRKLEARK